MSQPVKLSDALVFDARMAGEYVERSIAGQVEFWARLGRAIEPLIRGDQALSLCRSAAAKPLSECMESVDSAEGRRRVAEYLQSQPYPHYEPHPSRPGLLVRTDENGKRTVGRFVNREFKEVKHGSKLAAEQGRSSEGQGRSWQGHGFSRAAKCAEINAASAAEVSPSGPHSTTSPSSKLSSQRKRVPHPSPKGRVR